MKKIKLLHIQLCAILSGVQNAMLLLLEALPQDKYDIYVISRSDGELPQRVAELGFTHIPLDCLVQPLSPKDIIASVKLYRIIKRIKPNIVHTHSSKTGFLGRIIARLAGVKLIIHTIHGFPFHPYQNKLLYTFYTKLEAFAAKFAHINVSVNTYERELAINKLGFNPNKIITIFNGAEPAINTKTYSPECLQAHSLHLVSVLRFTPQKNVIYTIQKAIEIVKENKDVTFTFIGGGEQFKTCQQLVERSQTADNIILKGWVKSPGELLVNYDAFLLLSLWEGFSIAILEAMSVGLPIICSNIKGNNELVDSENGWLVDLNNDHDLMNIIQQIYVNKEILIKKGQASIEKVTNLFNLELYIKKYEELYEKGSKI